ncbi:MAG: response regulator transcription factor [Oscillospiraceae bacterium]
MIFCVEDDSSIRDLMIYTLKASGFEAEGFADGGALFEALKTQKPRLIMLDVMLPGEDGISVLKKLRSKSSTADIPVIMATAKTTEYDKVLGLDSGADDYLSKPFGMMEMVSRIKAVLRRTEPKSEARTLSLGKISVNLAEHTVISDGERVQLTLKEFDMLCLLMENPGRVYTRDQLLSKIWESDYAGETRTVDVHIGTLRTKLGKCGEYIETVRGVGYKMENKL